MKAIKQSISICTIYPYFSFHSIQNNKQSQITSLPSPLSPLNYHTPPFSNPFYPIQISLLSLSPSSLRNEPNTNHCTSPSKLRISVEIILNESWIFSNFQWYPNDFHNFLKPCFFFHIPFIFWLFQHFQITYSFSIIVFFFIDHLYF